MSCDKNGCASNTHNVHDSYCRGCRHAFEDRRKMEIAAKDESYIPHYYAVRGITGEPCVGKSYYCKQMSEQYGYYHIDVDRIANDIREQKHSEVMGLLGTTTPKEISEIIFEDDVKRKSLMDLLIPDIYKVVSDQCIERMKNQENVIIDAALLFELGLDKLCYYKSEIVVSKEIQLERAYARGWDKEELERRSNIIRNQIPFRIPKTCSLTGKNLIIE